MNMRNRILMASSFLLICSLISITVIISAKSKSKEKVTERGNSNVSVIEVTSKEPEVSSTVVTEDIQIQSEPLVESSQTSNPVVSATSSVTSHNNENVNHNASQDAIDIAKVLYRECRGVPSITQQACVAWTILNRVDKHNSSIHDVVRAPNQFAFYENTPVWDNLLDLANDVLDRWHREKAGEENVCRVLPKEYLYFDGKGGTNRFRKEYRRTGEYWDYSVESPYAS